MPENSPRKSVYAVTERNDRTFWTRIGAAFENRDGSLTVRLDAMPINGTLQIRDERPDREHDGDARPAAPARH